MLAQPVHHILLEICELVFGRIGVDAFEFRLLRLRQSVYVVVKKVPSPEHNVHITVAANVGIVAVGPLEKRIHPP
jgi:hypothetical protein